MARITIFDKKENKKIMNEYLINGFGFFFKTASCDNV